MTTIPAIAGDMENRRTTVFLERGGQIEFEPIANGEDLMLRYRFGGTVRAGIVVPASDLKALGQQIDQYAEAVE